ncbi:MAG: MFS transporter [Oscillospiraceae bacterium]|nr:MAG: MFS transporter [Oscillospiraceae bacterium]
MKTNYKKTMYACFIGYIVQAIVNNFVPLLFVTFQNSYNISLSQVTSLITVNFIIQLLIDMLSAGFIDKIGYRASAVTAHVFAASGLILLTVLPELLPDSFSGIIISVVIYAVGGGLLEVLVSPIIEACPTDNKEKAMSLLHSFYCWGHVGVILISTVFFYIVGISNWRILTLIWAVIPIANIFLFIKAPIYTLNENGNQGLGLKELFKKKIFWILMLMMMSAGASEQAVSQWASAFAEKALGISKTAGDLAGPMTFAILMGTARLIYGKYGDKFNLDRFMKYSCILCIISYSCISLIPVPAISLLGCAICGFSVGILWPGTFSKASAAIRGGGTALFAMLALAGDFGCSAGPSLAGYISSGFGGNLKAGILAATVFPVILLISLFALNRSKD